jgi:hypothetical protein
MKGIVINTGKMQDNYNKTGKKISAGFEVQDGKEKAKVWVNANNANSPKADFLLSLSKGDTVYLVKEKARGDIPEYWDIDTWALIAEKASSNKGVGFNEAFAQSRKRSKWFQEQGIKVAEEVWAEHFQSKPQEKDMGTLFDRGGAIGTGLHMDMIAKGHK